MPANTKRSATKQQKTKKGKQSTTVPVPVVSPKTKLSKATKVPLPRESSPDVQDLAPTDSEDEDGDLLEFDEEEEEDLEMQPLSGEEDSDEDVSGSEDESEDVTPEAMERMMELLGEVDAAELGLLGPEDDDEDEEEEEGSDEEEEDDDEKDEEEEEEALYEELEEADTDVVPVEKNTTNDKVALERVLASIQVKTNFFDTLTLVNPVPLHVPDASNDLERELEFYKQSLWAATHAESLFTKASLPFHRPSDYFAEMVKTDDHMSKIRQSLLDEQAGMKASEEARKLRELKKFGKKVQVEKIREREKEKKAVGERLESLKKKRKNGDAFTSTEDFDVALEDALATSSSANKKQKMNESERPGRGRKGLTRKGRDSKFGFGGGAGRRSKSNNDREDGDGGFGGGGRGRGGATRGGRGGARGGRGRGGGGGGAKQRPGKSRRQ
ncbi:EBP2 family rRNA-processing protein [Sporobolomyces salmoneus]|uniref:EBP2 family rRNA-processing protein n=1 Tax=Sporobolomyces salmoneus TaxID=183962 RepID=UPI00316B857C